MMLAAALAAPPVELSVSGLGSGSRAVIDGGGEVFSTFVGLDDPGVQVVRSRDSTWLVFDLCLRLGFDRLTPTLPEISRIGPRRILHVRPTRDSYAVWVRPNVRAADNVRVGPVGAPIEALQSASAFGTQLDTHLAQGGELHHRIAVRVDRARRDGLMEFPLIYRLEAEKASTDDLTTNRRWR